MASLIALNTLTFTPASSILPTIIFYTSAKMTWSFSHSKYLIASRNASWLTGELGSYGMLQQLRSSGPDPWCRGKIAGWDPQLQGIALSCWNQIQRKFGEISSRNGTLFAFSTI